MMAVSSGHPRCDFPPLSDTYLVVNAVDGMEPGAYYYRRQTREFELLKAANFRREAGYLCLEQPLGADCSALVCYMGISTAPSARWEIALTATLIWKLDWKADEPIWPPTRWGVAQPD